MQRKTIQKIISKKMNDWIGSITDQDLQTKIKDEIIVTGGAIVSLLLNEQPKDYDVYLKTKETVKQVALYYADKFNNRKKSSGAKAFVLDGGKFLSMSDDEREKTYGDLVNVMEHNIDENRIKIFIKSQGVASEDPDMLNQPFEDVYDVIEEADDIPADQLEDKDEEEKEKFRPIFLSANAITLANKVQLIIRFYGEPTDIHSNYDFIHCTNFWTFETGLITNIDALESVLAKTLIYQGSKYPLCSVIRTRKFINRGWHINA